MNCSAVSALPRVRPNCKQAAPQTAAQIDAAVARLTGAGRTAMGALFKAVAFAHPALGAPPAFET